MELSIPSKLPTVGNSIFTEMSQLATEYSAVNLGQGFPDFSMDAALIDLVSKAMRDDCNQYAPMSGLPLLREKLAEKVNQIYNITQTFIQIPILQLHQVARMLSIPH